MQNTLDQKNFISALAEKHGFLASGFARAEKLHDTESLLTDWLEKGFHGKMAYMENHFQKRLNPSLLVEGAKTVICFAYNYFPKAKPLENSEGVVIPQIAKYAWGDDYHHVIKEKLFAIMGEIQSQIPSFEGRAFVDSAPVMERQWAERAGLGWIGKNSLLLRKGVGSFFFLAEIVCNLELEPDKPQTDHCGECTACIDACPTQAIVQPQVIDSRRCISYLTIEDKTYPESNQAIPNNDPIGKLGTRYSVTQEKNETAESPINAGAWAYGCDICQDVCPWNRFSQPHQEPQFAPREMISWNPAQWKKALTEPAQIKSQLKKSAMQRAGLKKLKSQIAMAMKYQQGHS